MPRAAGCSGRTRRRRLAPRSCAEWSAFWDSASVDWIFRHTPCLIVQFPLDITDQAKITTGFAIDVELNATQGCIKPREKGRGGREVQVVLNFAAAGGQQRFYDCRNIRYRGKGGASPPR